MTQNEREREYLERLENLAYDALARIITARRLGPEDNTPALRDAWDAIDALKDYGETYDYFVQLGRI